MSAQTSGMAEEPGEVSSCKRAIEISDRVEMKLGCLVLNLLHHGWPIGHLYIAQTCSNTLSRKTTANRRGSLLGQRLLMSIIRMGLFIKLTGFDHFVGLSGRWCYF